MSGRTRWWLAGAVACLAVVASMVLAPRASADFGTNWTAQFYNNTSLSGDPVLTQTGLPGVNFIWGEGSPDPAVDDDQFSARFTSIQTFTGGTYDFIVTSDDGVRVYIDGVNVLDRFFPRPQTTDRFTREVTAGTHSLVVEYFEEGDEAMVQVQWFLVAPAVPVVPTSQLIITPNVVFTPGFFPTPGPTAIPAPTGPAAQVTFVRALAVRTGPYLGATYITRLTRDVPWYTVDARNNSEGVYNWYRVTTPDGRTGWASGRYLQLNVDPLTLPEAGSIFDEIDNAEDRNVIGIPRAVMNLRSRPSVRAPEIGDVGYGEQVSIIGRTVQGGRDRWYQVRRSNGQVGWIFAEFVTVRGEINAVPIR